MNLSDLKRTRLQALSTPTGTIAALAIDQRKSLRRMLAEAAGVPLEAIRDEQLSDFKIEVTRRLSRWASAVLLDPEYGLDAARERDSQCGLLLAYEADGYENPRPHRMLALLPHQSVSRLAQAGATGVKVLLSYHPDGDPESNDQKRAWIERIGAECAALGIPFFLEPLLYDPAGLDPREFEFARRKPGLVVRIMEEFSKPVYGVDVLKVEFPVNVAFVEGSAVYQGRRAQSLDEALDWYRRADAAAGRPYIYLSAGVSNAEFTASLELAARAGARFSGVLCGRANWQDGASVYMRQGQAELARWLETEGAANMRRVNQCLEAAIPWTERM